MKKIIAAFLALSCWYYPSSAQINPELLAELEFRNIGPTRGGRATAVAGIPTQPGTFYMGATGGGVWKTGDYGQGWENISDGYFETGSIGAIRVSLSDPDIVYVGTGSDGIRSNVLIGKGVYKSADAGKTWSHVGLKDAGQIGAVEIHPANPDIVLVSVIGMPFGRTEDRGVYRTHDGGQSWDKVLYHSDSVGSVDLEFAPDDPNTIYATMWRAERKPWTIISGSDQDGIYKSTDGGDSWDKLTNGLPSNPVGKIDLAVCPAAPDIVYALVEAPQGVGGVYKSTDRGESFVHISPKEELIDRPFYYCNIDVNPLNPDNLFVNSTRFWISNDGGKTWRSKRTPHGDNHDMWINPLDTNLWVQCNDGGANVTRDGGETWSSIDNQPTAELYQVEVDDQFPYWVYAGQQDNSTIAVPVLPPYNPPGGPMSFWMAVGGCETGPAVPKPGNHNIVYSNCKGRFGVYNKTTGQERQFYVGAGNMYGHNPSDLKYRFQRVSPIHVSPHDPDIVYHTSQFVHRTSDDGHTWEIISPDLTANTPETQVISGSPITRDITGEEFYSTIYAIRESGMTPGLIWVGANDGPVHVTRDGGTTWTNVTPATMPPQGRIDCVEPSPHRSNKAYIAGFRFLLGDFKPYIYKTEDYGQSWTLLTPGDNGIPGDNPTRVVREDPEVEGLLYAGTETGIYVSFDDGANWQPLKNNFPVVPITDLKLHRNTLAISTMGRSFWILDDLMRLREVAAMETLNVCHLFAVSDAYRMRYRPSFDVPQYARPGVNIDYYIHEEVENVRLDILDEEGNMVQSFEGDVEGGPQEASEPSMATGFFMPPGNPKLDAGVGAHRFTWNMRHTGAWHSRERMSGMGGPMVAPGNYRARLTIDGQVFTQPFRIDLDPRVRNAGITDEDVIAQEQLNLKVVQLLSDARRLTSEVEKMLESFQGADLTPDQMQEKERLEIIQDQLVTKEGRYQTPMLVDQIRYLSGMLTRADQRPGKDAYERFDELQSTYNSLKPEFDKLVGDKE